MKAIKRLTHHFKHKQSGTAKPSRYTKSKTGCHYCQQAGVIQFTYWPVATQTVSCRTISMYPVVPISPTCYVSPGASVIFSNGQWVHNQSSRPIYATQVMPYTGYAKPASLSLRRQPDRTPRSIPSPPSPPLSTSESGTSPRPTLGHRITPPATRPKAEALPTLSKEEQDFVDILNDYVAFHNKQSENIQNHNLLEYIETPTNKEYCQNMNFIVKLKLTLSKYKTAIQSSAMENHYYDKISKDLIKKFEPDNFAV